jgi:hypothetical protein
MRRTILVLAAAFGIALAVVLGIRLETASLSVVVGVVLGIVAGLPVSGALLYLMWRERQERLRLEEEQWRRQERTTPASPPVIVLNAGQGSSRLPGPGGFALGHSQDRDFVIVGEEDLRQQ